MIYENDEQHFFTIIAIILVSVRGIWDILATIRETMNNTPNVFIRFYSYSDQGGVNVDCKVELPILNKNMLQKNI